VTGHPKRTSCGIRRPDDENAWSRPPGGVIPNPWLETAACVGGVAVRHSNRRANGGGGIIVNVHEFATTHIPEDATEIAPDGSAVRVLLGVAGGTMAHFALSADETSRAITHKTVEEIWLVLAGAGELWRRQAAREEIVALGPGVCVSLPKGTHFQFRASQSEGVTIVAATIPRWPGDDEVEFVWGPWAPAMNVSFRNV
jgi:mannose-6-phosphate isomerase-like protein (cupin superfamily)